MWGKDTCMCKQTYDMMGEWIKALNDKIMRVEGELED
jgi:hypothetical protein